MTAITFHDALLVLSRSSPFSVKTMSSRAPDSFDALEHWLYTQQDIVKDLRERLTRERPGNISFLRGCSGDGKFKILTRLHQAYSDTVTFHLDAIHSFQPHQSTMEALDQIFDAARGKKSILAIGISIGTIGNHVQEGHQGHRDIKCAARVS
jgi:DNA phosphorothioation-dependent restriction protein DptF